MELNVLYVENNARDWQSVEDAVNAYNNQTTPGRINIWRASEPSEIPHKITHRTDVVIADLYYDDPEEGPDKKLCIDEIILSVNGWSDKQKLGRPIPIIAYTGKSRKGLDECLKRKEHLFDIWDKHVASPPYIIWRLSQLSDEISRIRPDVLLQRLIWEMSSPLRWHQQIVEMTKRYNSGWTEADQIEKAGKSIQDIAHILGVWEDCMPMWQVMAKWESLGRSVSNRMRGHARHVVNVFWLGYYLLQQDALREWFGQAWRKNVEKRSRTMGAVIDGDPLEGLANTWFYASLFHDIGNCVEKSEEVLHFHESLLSNFKGLSPIHLSAHLDETKKKQLVELTKRKMFEMESVGHSIFEVIEGEFQNNTFDHGVLAGLHLCSVINKGAQNCYAQEAARAMILHNVITRVPAQEITLSWKEEPLGCLLLLCDQLQTWDRERGDHKLSEEDGPQRAELTELTVSAGTERPRIHMAINYLAPPHLRHATEICTRVKDSLEYILKDKPHRALARISRPWPFELQVDCSLSGDPLEGARMVF